MAMASPTRRILGEKDVNAALSPTKPLSAKMSDLKAVTPDLVNMPTPRLAEDSKKRPFDDAESSTPDESDALTGHATKRSRPDSPTVQEPARLGTETSANCTQESSQQALSPTALTTEAVTSLPRVETITEEAPLRDMSEPPSQTATVADSVSELSAAETLRLKLRVAVYKVRTDQVSAPLSRLELNTSTPSTPRAELEIRDPPEDTMRAFRRASTRAYRQRSHPSRPRHTQERGPRLSYAPYDVRLPTFQEQELEKQTRYIRSSSPACSDCDGDDGPLEERAREPATPMSVMDRTAFSSPESPEKVASRGPAMARVIERDLTSSAIKGNAADSLLRLGGGM